MQAAVMGLGSWGTAFAVVLADAGHSVRIWGRNPTTVAAVQESRCNEAFHPGLELGPAISAVAAPQAALAGADLVVLAVPRSRCERTW